MADNRTHFIVDAQQFISTDEVFLTWESFNVLAHMQSAGDSQVPDFYQWNEDGVLADFQFSVDNTKSVSIDSLAIALVISDGTTTVELDRIDVNLSPNAGDPPIINTNDLRGYVLPAASEFNLVQIIDGGTVATKTFYDGVVGQKITWQEWIANANIPAAFIDITQGNDGLNQKADNYSNVSGYQVYLKGIAQVTGDDSTQGRVSRSYETLSPIITVYNYDESDDGEIVSATIETFDSTDTHNLGGSIIVEQDTIFKCTWVGLSPLVLADLGYVIHRIERENAPGNLEIEEISTFRGAVAGGKLSNIQVVQSGDDLVSTCTINANSLTGGNWKLSTRIQIPAYAIAVQVASTYAGGSVLIEDLTAATSEASFDGNALLSSAPGNSIRVTLSIDPTADPGNAALLWAGVNISLPNIEGQAWSTTAQEYPYGKSSGNQIPTARQITFTMPSDPVLVSEAFYNAYDAFVLQHYTTKAHSEFSDIATDYNSTVSSVVEDTNPPQTTASGLTDLVGLDPTITDMIQNGGAAKSAQAPFDGNKITFTNATTVTYTQSDRSNRNQVYADKINNSPLSSLFTVSTTTDPVLNAAGYCTSALITLVVFKSNFAGDATLRRFLGFGGQTAGAGYYETVINVGAGGGGAGSDGLGMRSSGAGGHFEYTDAVTLVQQCPDPNPINTTNPYLMALSFEAVGTFGQTQKAWYHIYNQSTGLIRDINTYPQASSCGSPVQFTLGGQQNDGDSGNTTLIDHEFYELLVMSWTITEAQTNDLITRLMSAHNIT